MSTSFDYDRKRAMKQKDFKPCIRCGKGVMHTGSPLFYRVTVERMGIDVRAVQRQHGLEMMMHGNAAIAAAMGPDDDMGLPIGPADKGLLCSNCAHDIDCSFAAIVEAFPKETEEAEQS